MRHDLRGDSLWVPSARIPGDIHPGGSCRRTTTGKITSQGPIDPQLACHGGGCGRVPGAASYQGPGIPPRRRESDDPMRALIEPRHSARLHRSPPDAGVGRRGCKDCHRLLALLSE